MANGQVELFFLDSIHKVTEEIKKCSAVGPVWPPFHFSYFTGTACRLSSNFTHNTSSYIYYLYDLIYYSVPLPSSPYIYLYKLYEIYFAFYILKSAQFVVSLLKSCYRSWRTNLLKGSCVLISTSVEHEGAVTKGTTRAVTLASRYLIEPCGTGKSRLTHITRVDLR